MKCARCGHQWRLVREEEEAETLEEAAFSEEPDQTEETAEHYAHAPSPAEERDNVFAHEDVGYSDARTPSFAGTRPSWETRREDFSAAIATMSESSHSGQDDDVNEHGGETLAAKAELWRSRFDEPEEEATASRNFDASGQDRSAAADWTSPRWAERTQPSWGETVESDRREADDQGEDTEGVIRRALKAALEQPDQDGAYREGFPAQKPAWSEEGDWPKPLQPNPDEQSGLHGHGAGAAFEEAEGGERIARRLRDRLFGGRGGGADAGAADDEVPFKLSGANARTPIFGGARDDEGGAEDDFAPENPAFQSDIEDAFKAGPFSQRPAERLAARAEDDDELSDFGRLYDEQFARDGDELDAQAALERDAAELQAQLESTDVARYEKTRRVGGLAVAAAWAVFVSVISGVVLALTAFRADIIAALPGTAALYSALGFEVAENGVDFADVSYRWTVSDGKPMIEVTGQVVNVTDRTVTVPKVLINVRDAESLNNVQATASVPADSLAPRQSASFTLEFVSPPQNISQIELEFDRTR